MEAARKTRQRGAAVPASDPAGGCVSEKPVAESRGEACTPEFVASSFTVAGKWAPPTHPSMGEWMETTRPIHPMDDRSAFTREGVLTPVQRGRA